MLVECVPNFSDGRDPATAAALRAAIGSVPRVRLLDWHSDPDHNRSVATFVGPGESVAEAAYAAIAASLVHIDLRRHRGVHPRLGATDVCPFVPLRAEEMPGCVALAHGLGERVGRELELPVYYYGEASRHPARRSLPDVRRGGFEKLCDAIALDPARAPDAGPSRIHPSGGAIAIGARSFLIAFNVNLDSADIAAAREIARGVRASSGGLPGVRALGFLLESAGFAQVSINLCEPERTGLVRVFREVQRLAGERGIGIRGSELVGLAPRAALDAEVARAVQLTSFDPRRQVLEEALAAEPAAS